MENRPQTIGLKKGRIALYDFGDAFDGTVYTMTDVIEGDVLTLAGVDMHLVPNDDAFDIEIPAMNAAYIHMMGHDCRSIVASAGHADALIDQLEHLEQRGFDLVLTSHHRPETRSDLRRKKAYLSDVGRLARESDSAESFRRDIMRLYPDHGGLNRYDGGIFVPQAVVARILSFHGEAASL